MGRILLVTRLAARDLRRRPGEAALLLLAILGATTTLTLALALQGMTREPFQSTREATAGPDVVLGESPDPFDSQAVVDLARLEGWSDAPGVVAHGGPYPVTEATLVANGQTLTAWTEGRATTQAAIDQPDLREGGWVSDGGVVVEAAFADALGVDIGDPITLNDRSFAVVGVAVSAASPPYPELSCLGAHCIDGTGLIWLTDADARSLVPGEHSLGYILHLQLADPDAAPAFVAEHTGPPDGPAGKSWQEILEQADNVVRNQRRALLIGSRLIGLLAVASVAVLVGGRMADQTRRVGQLKAVGGTPGLAAAVLLAEYVVVALVAAAAGLTVGHLTAPLLSEPSAGLLGRAGRTTLTLSTVLQVTAVSLGVAVAATLGPAVRAARTSTVRALADAARPPRRTAWLLGVSARLPAPLLLGLRVAARRPRRVVLSTVSFFVTVSGIVAALGAHADLDTSQFSSEADQRLNQVLLVITLTLGAMAAVNTVFITTATVIDNRHASALARALGATPQQVSAGLTMAQVLPALLGATLGIPGGLGLLAAVDPESPTFPPLWQSLAVVPATVLIVAALTTIPARLGARRPAAETLQSELV